MRKFATIDGNEAAASVAHRSSEVIAIYPITPSSGMGELADEWSAKGRVNLWGQVPEVLEMQSEAGAAGAVHGALQGGALATTFTSSQGLLLMIPNLYKIAGELTPFCMHVAARTLATHALSIFGDHSDVMACRQTGFALLCASSVQEAHDFACIAHAATLRARVPFMHFFDGFRTSHEVAKIETLSDADLLALYDVDAITAFRRRALSPDWPVLRGSAQNPDAFFQAREAGNPYYDACPRIVQETLEDFAERTGRRYHLFDYRGHPQAERVIVVMGSGAQTVEETVERLVARGERVGVLVVRLYRPFSIERFVAALPASVRSIAVLDRTKEPGAVGEPLYVDVIAALHEARASGTSGLAADPRIVGGRYGLSSKEFTPAMAKAVFDELAQDTPRNHFTLGIVDDVTHHSLDWDPSFDVEPDEVFSAVFYGLGADGTVGANKNSIKIVGEATELYPQGYFVYDSKKSGSLTVSHLRISPKPIRSAYLVPRARFVAVHQFSFFERYDVLERARPGATLLVNAPIEPERLWDELPADVQHEILDRRLELWTIDATRVASEAGIGNRINTIMQTCFFAITGVVPRELALEKIKESIAKSYGRKGEDLVARNCAAVDAALAHLHRVNMPSTITSTRQRAVSPLVDAPDFVQRVTGAMIAGKGDLLPVSAFPPDGTWPTGTSRFEKRNIATEIPVWDAELCIQCNKCALLCPHSAIRAKAYDASQLAGAPSSLKTTPFRGDKSLGSNFTLQVAPEDCTGCGLCVAVCPVTDKADADHKAIDMRPLPPLLAAERANYDFFLALPEVDRSHVKFDNKGTQLLEPLFEYSGACAGCGETPYIKLLTQVLGDRLLIANATGCSSIFGGNLPTTPYCKNAEGRGPAWANSLFEDNAEFGLGLRLAVDSLRSNARLLLRDPPAAVANVAAQLLESHAHDEGEVRAQRERVRHLRERLRPIMSSDARRLDLLADYLVPKSVWLVGGDGWAYDIGFGGLDHVLSTGRNVKVLVLDTEVYSNTGGQQSKSTPRGASAKFAVAGKTLGKKDLALMAMSYGHVYVARIALGAKDNQAVKALLEAEAYDGPALVIAYSHCIAHGYDMAFGADQQKLAVSSGAWPLFRYDPRRAFAGEAGLTLDSGEPTTPLREFMQNETRFRTVQRDDPERFERLLEESERENRERFALLKLLAARHSEKQTAGSGSHHP